APDVCAPSPDGLADRRFPCDAALRPDSRAALGFGGKRTLWTGAAGNALLAADGLAAGADRCPAGADLADFLAPGRGHLYAADVFAPLNAARICSADASAP